MVIPWIGFPLSKLIKNLIPPPKLNGFAFKQSTSPVKCRDKEIIFWGGGIDYPYVEGLRLDEAMHLNDIGSGLVWKNLPPQNGAPVRLVVPWKYGFKSIKSIVDINLVSKKPRTTWNLLASNEYGFYANVNPEVDHPRWSRAYERRITSGGIFNQKKLKHSPLMDMLMRLLISTRE